MYNILHSESVLPTLCMYLIWLKINQHSVVFGGIEETSSPSPPHFQQHTMLYCDFCVMLQLSVDVTSYLRCFLFSISATNLGVEATPCCIAFSMLYCSCGLIWCHIVLCFLFSVLNSYGLKWHHVVLCFLFYFSAMCWSDTMLYCVFYFIFR